MDRRGFLGCGTIAGLAATLGRADAATPATGRVASQPHAPKAPIDVPAFELDEVTLAELQKQMSAGTRTSRQITEAYLQRIAALDRQGPELRSVIETNPEALEIAAALDAERKAKGPRGPLHGIPVLVKDNVDTSDKMTTTAGSLALEGSIAERDSHVAKRLRDAGALILGKANLSEWANFRSTRSISGWSGRGGQCRNPYALDRNPCGSSSGSGVAAAADLAVAAVGTETDGSIVCPSGANGDVGIKPTLGLWSRAGVIPISADQDTAGPIARNVTDAAVLLGAATGVDPNDPATAAQVGHASTDYTRFLDSHALDGARIGIWRDGTFTPEVTGSVVNQLLAQVKAELQARGATVVDPTNVDLSSTANEGAALNCEFKSDIASYLHTYVHGTNPVTGQPYPQTLADLIAFNNAHPNLEGPWNNAVWDAAEATGGRDAACAALRTATTPPVQASINGLMAANHLDAIVALTNNPAWPTDDNPNEGDLAGHFEYFISSSSAGAVSGYPDITVPAAHDQGLPMGITFVGSRWDEGGLIGLAYDYEQATHVRVPPQFIPTIGDALFPGLPNP